MSHLIHVTELQQDALGEVFNIGVGRAAASLSEIIREEIDLTAPTVEFHAPEEINQCLKGSQFEHLSLVVQDFEGPFDARAMLLFPEENSLIIVGKMLGEVVPPKELSEYEQEAMCEVGNIILNACISALADLFEVEFTGSLPEYHHAERETLDLLGAVRENIPVVLIVQIDLVIRHQSIHGHILFLLSVSSLNELIDSIDRYLKQQGLV